LFKNHKPLAFVKISEEILLSVVTTINNLATGINSLEKGSSERYHKMKNLLTINMILLLNHKNHNTLYCTAC